jgi:TetR/AcrR family transcriptional repressor of nem operon
MKPMTKDRILAAGAQIIHLKGYNNTGIQEILDSAGIPKGSFYNYFKSKEDFGLQVIDYYVEYFARLAAGILEDGSLSPLERIRRILDWFIGFFRSKDYAYGCPIGNLAQEMGDLSPTFQARLRAAVESMASNYAKVIEEAKAAGEVGGGLDARETAGFIVSSWHGALIHMKVMKSSEPLENHLKFILDYVLTA